VAKKKRSAKQIAATKKMVAANRKSRKAGKRGPGRPRGSKRDFAFARSAGVRGAKMGLGIRSVKVAHADVVDKAHGLKPTSFLVDMLNKIPAHQAKLVKTIQSRLASDARPGAGRKKAAKKAKKHAKKHAGGRKRGPGRPKGSKNKRHAKTANAVHRKPGRPKGSKNKKRGPGRPKGSKKHAKKRVRTPGQLRNDARLRAKGDRTRLKNQKKWGKKRHKTAHKSSGWQATTPGFAGVSILG